jgi:hypothetical protein
MTGMIEVTRGTNKEGMKEIHVQVGPVCQEVLTTEDSSIYLCLPMDEPTLNINTFTDGLFIGI